jgi:hypothetical protein
MIAVLLLSLLCQADANAAERAGDFARRLERAVADGELITLDMAMNGDAFYDRVVGATKLSPGLVQFLKPMIRMSFTSQPYFATAKGRGTWKFLRIRKADDGLRALFRLTGQGGAYSYHEMLLAPQADRFWISDYYVLNFAGFQSDLVRRSLLPSPAALEVLNQLRAPTATDFMMDYSANPLNQLSQLVTAGEHRKALEKYDEHVAVLKNVGIAQVLHVNAARMIDEKTCAKALQQMAEVFKNDPAVDMSALGASLDFEPLEKSLEIINRIDKAVGGDVFMNILRGNAYLGAKQPDKARDLYRGVTEAEPTLDQGWWGLITVHLSAKEFKDVVRCLDGLEKNLNITVGDVSKIELYKDFIASPEYSEWMKGRDPK